MNAREMEKFNSRENHQLVSLVEPSSLPCCCLPSKQNLVSLIIPKVILCTPLRGWTLTWNTCSLFHFYSFFQKPQPTYFLDLFTCNCFNGVNSQNFLASSTEHFPFQKLPWTKWNKKKPRDNKNSVMWTFVHRVNEILIISEKSFASALSERLVSQIIAKSFIKTTLIRIWHTIHNRLYFWKTSGNTYRSDHSIYCLKH